MAYGALDVLNQRLAMTAELGIPIAGSLGRAALIGNTHVPPLRLSGQPRDIDVVNVAQFSEPARQLPSGDLFDKIWLSPFVRLQNGTHELIYPGVYDGVSKIEPKIVMKVPYFSELFTDIKPVKINQQEILTLRPEAQLAIDSMRGKAQPKNRTYLKLLQEVVDDIPINNRLDPVITDPLIQFGQEIDSLLRVRIYKSFRQLYHGSLPPGVVNASQKRIARIARGAKLI